MPGRILALALQNMLFYGVFAGFLWAQAPGMPMSIDPAREANTRWLAKPILESRGVDSMEDLGNWSHSGPGQMTLSAEKFRDGRQSLRLVSRTVTDTPNVRAGRPHGEATLRRSFKGEDWSAFNRLSIWVFPTLPGFKIGSVVLKLNNQNPPAEQYQYKPTHGLLHYALVKPGQWNHIVWEIPHLARSRVLSLELTYRLQGNEPGATDTVTFDWDQLELQRVEPDYFEGWAVAPGRISFSHTGYESSLPKAAFASGLRSKHFFLIDADKGETVFTRPLRTLKNELGEFQVMDFPEVTKPGRYLLASGGVSTEPFRIGPDIWRATIWKTINFFYCERCGDRIEGIHDVCHADWQAEHNGRKILVNGGWHDAGDLSQGLVNTGEAVYAMFSLAEQMAVKDPVLSKRLMQEATWGLDWVEKTRFGDGFRVTWGTMDYWTDCKVGTADDTFADARSSPTDNAVGAAASAIAARLLKQNDPVRAQKSLETSRADWQFAIDKLPASANVETLSAVALASVELFKATADQKYADKAVELGRLLVDSQQRTWTTWPMPMAGFFYTSPRRDRILNYMHRGHDQGPVVALTELCRALPKHGDWMDWYSAIALHSDHQQRLSRLNEPYGVLCAGVYKVADNPAQVSKGLRINDDYFVRRFPVWYDMRGHFGILLSQTKALAAAGRLRNRADLLELAHAQLQWVVGRNPFSQSTMYGEGFDYAPQYTAMSGDMTGSLPVGIQTCGDLDNPYWPATNCWNYKEVWVHPSSRWLFIMADLAGSRAEPLLKTTLSCQRGDAGRLTVTAKVEGSGRHSITLRVYNLHLEQPNRFVALRPEVPTTLTWEARIENPSAPWVAAIIPDDDPSQVQDLTSQPRERVIPQ